MRSLRALFHVQCSKGSQRGGTYVPTQMAATDLIWKTTAPPCRIQGFPRKQIDFVWQGSVHAAPLGRRETKKKTTTAHPTTACRISASKIQLGNAHVSAIHLSALLLPSNFRKSRTSMFLSIGSHLHWACLPALGMTCIHPSAAATPRSNPIHFV